MNILIILFWSVSLTTAGQIRNICYDKNEELVCINAKGCSLSSQMPWKYCHHGICCRKATNLFSPKRDEMTSSVQQNFNIDLNAKVKFLLNRYPNFSQLAALNKKVENDKTNNAKLNNSNLEFIEWYFCDKNILSIASVPVNCRWNRSPINVPEGLLKINFDTKRFPSNVQEKFITEKPPSSSAVSSEISTVRNDIVPVLHGRLIFTNKHLLVNETSTLTVNYLHNSDDLLEKNDNGNVPKYVLACRNYTALSNSVINVNPLKIDRKPHSIEIENCPPKLIPLIVGGTRSVKDEFPHMVALGYNKSGRIDYLCGGSLISEKYSLTAAHCLETRWGEPVVVHAGSIDLEFGNKLIIEYVIKHPDYKLTSGDHDIGIVKTKLSLKLSNLLKPACLPSIETKAQYPESIAFATGWGKLGSLSLSSNILMKVPLKIVDNQICEKYYQNEIKSKALERGVDEKLICAKGSNSKDQDTCQGDSGGPLQALLSGSSCTWQVVGITSFGKLCGSGFPAIYTRVASYVPWIETVVWPD